MAKAIEIIIKALKAADLALDSADDGEGRMNILSSTNDKVMGKLWATGDDIKLSIESYGAHSADFVIALVDTALPEARLSTDHLEDGDDQELYVYASARKVGKISTATGVCAVTLKREI